MYGGKDGNYCFWQIKKRLYNEVTISLILPTVKQSSDLVVSATDLFYMQRNITKQVLVLLEIIVFCTPMYANVYYVATNGNNTNNGSITQPFATIQQAQNVVNAGDTVYVRGGKYFMQNDMVAKQERLWLYITALTKSGTPNKRINYWAYPNEQPVFDCSAIKSSDYRVIAFFVSGSWLHIKGLEVTGVQVGIKTHTQSECFENQGSNNIYEGLSMHDGMAIGIYLIGGANNLFLNCDAYNNWDYYSENGRGGNTDGFGCHPKKGDVGNVFRGCRAWFNSDDGFDLINSHESVTFDHCWAMYNGFSSDFKSQGDGNGFKAGGYGKTPVDKLPNPIPSHVIQFCLAVRNKANGFYANHHIVGNKWYNNSAYGNTVNFNMLSRLPDNVTDVDGYGHLLRNNLGYNGKKETDKIDTTKCDLANNYFTLPVTVSKSDFISLNEQELLRPRQADYSLPVIQFMHLTAKSNLIDKGVNIGFQFAGKAPDFGAFEYQ